MRVVFHYDAGAGERFDESAPIVPGGLVTVYGALEGEVVGGRVLPGGRALEVELEISERVRVIGGRA